MLKAAFLHDSELDFPGGAELSIKAILAVCKEHGVDAVYDNLQDFRKTARLIGESDFVIVSSTFLCNYEFLLIDFLANGKIPYVKWEHDHNFCAKRSAICFANPEVKGCCETGRFTAYRKFFSHASLSVFGSPKHYETHHEIYGEAIQWHLILPPLIDVAEIRGGLKEPNSVCFVGDLNFHKGGHALLDFAEANPKLKIDVHGDNLTDRQPSPNVRLKGKCSNKEVLRSLSTTEYLFFKPKSPEAAGRIAAEAFLSGCKIITNEKVGFLSFPFYPAYPDEARKAMENAPHLFLEKVKESVQIKSSKTKRWTNVLIYKSFGGLGDFLFAIPAIQKIATVSDRVSLCVPSSLFRFLKIRFTEYEILEEDYILTANLDEYDKIIDLKNYPSFKKDEGNEHQLNFPSYRRLNQHALHHYLDAVATLHPEIDNSYQGFPHFEKKEYQQTLYFTVHAGAGFPAKHYPAKRFGQLIEMLLNLFEDLECKIIAGPDDPQAEDLFDKLPNRVSVPQGKLEDIAGVISGSLFHIGNDSGITHLAGAFNIPTVSIHGPTGPGTWGSFAEHAQVIWGKQNVCHIACNYIVSVNCEHRICLHSVSPQRITKHVLMLLKSFLPEGGSKRLVFNPEIEIDENDDAYILKFQGNEWLIEFTTDSEKDLFEKLIVNRLQRSEFSESFEKLLEVFIQNELVFEIPTLCNAKQKQSTIENIDVTIVGHINGRDSIGRHGIIFGEILQDSFSINGMVTRQASSLDVDPALLKALTTKKTTGKLALFTDVLWQSKWFEPYRSLPADAAIKVCYSMFESSIIPQEWVSIINVNFDGVLVPDPWLVDVYKNSGVTRPIKVLPLACYLNDFLAQPIKEKAGNVFTLGVSSAVWLRKNLLGVIESFKLAFKGKENVKLRIHSRYGLPVEVSEIIKAINNDPRIDFFVATLSPADYLSFMTSLDVYVFLSMGEGFSVTPREAMALGLPVILSDNTTHKTICNSGLVNVVSCETKVPAYYEVFNKTHGSFYKPNIEQAANYMRQLFEGHEVIYADAAARREWAAQYDVANMKEKYVSTFTQILEKGFHEDC